MPGRPPRSGPGAPRHLAGAGAAMALPPAGEPAQRAAEPSSPTPPQLSSCRHHGHDRVADRDLVAFLQQLGLRDAAPVERGAVGGAEVLDIPQATNSLETGVLARSEVVVDG